MNKRLRILSTVVLCWSIMIALVACIPSASATSSDTLLKKAALAGLYGCYNSSAYKNDFAVSDYQNAKWLVSNADAHTTYLPNGMTGVSNNHINCNEVLNGKSSEFSGLYSMYGKSTPINTSSTQSITSFLNGMGYDSKNTSSGECMRFEYSRKTEDTSDPNVPDGSGTETTTICADRIDGGKIAVDELSISYQRSSGTTTNSGSNEAMRFSVANGQITCKKPSVNFLGLPSWKDVSTINFQNTAWSDFKNNFLQNGCAPETVSYVSGTTQYTFKRSDVSYPPSNQITSQMTLAGDAGDRAIRYLSGMSYDSLKLNNEEKRSLLQYYLDSYYKIEKRCGLISEADEALATGDGFKPATIIDNGVPKLCYVKPTAHQTDGVYIWDSNDMLGGDNFTNGFDGLLGIMDFQLDQYNEERKQACADKLNSDRRVAQNLLNQSTTSEEYREKAKKMIAELDNIIRSHGQSWYEEDGEIKCYTYTNLEGQVVENTPAPPIDNSDPGSVNNNLLSSDIDACTGVAGSLGWILCPVLKVVSEGVDDIYDSYIQEQFLVVDPSKVQEGGSVYESWAVIRNAANTIFVILFLIVLFSQLTGIGLTNYGIKKMLPRLIVISVVVNVSFLICQFAVDVSNILGYGLNSLFDGMSTNAGLTGSLGQTTGATSGGTAATWVEVLGLAIAASTIGSWLIPLLLTLLSCAISVFFGAVILAARQAAIYILIVLAPAAIVCYALPNAKRAIFDRWLKIFTSMLMVFPICGALVGGGFFASNILLGANGGFFLTLVAMLLRVAPFLLIPSLVRSSMTALGNVGARISSLGDRLGGATTGAIRRSDGYQRLNEYGEQLRGRGISLRHRMLSAVTRGHYTGSRGSKRRLARAIGTQESRLRSDAKASAIASGGFISRGRARDIMASATDAEETQGIRDAENGYNLDENFNTDNASTVTSELERRLNELQEHPDNIEVRRKVKALTKILLESDDGRGSLMVALQKFASANPGSEATKILGRYLGNNENMGNIKSHNQRGLQNLVQHINNGQSIQSLDAYGAMGTNKINAREVGGMDKTALEAQVRAASGDQANGIAPTLVGRDLQNLAAVYTRALTSENAANEIKGEAVENLNEIRRLAYIEQHGSIDGFQTLKPGDELKITHTKSPVPAGWTESGVWVGGGSPTKQQQIAYEEWAKHSAEVDRYNSQL